MISEQISSESSHLSPGLALARSLSHVCAPVESMSHHHKKGSREHSSRQESIFSFGSTFSLNVPFEVSDFVFPFCELGIWDSSDEARLTSKEIDTDRYFPSASLPCLAHSLAFPHGASQGSNQFKFVYIAVPDSFECRTNEDDGMLEQVNCE